MRRLLTISLLALLVGVPSAAAAPVFFVEGRGWGHGIGMSQYGAYGYALREGRSHAWILRHYYPGTELSEAGVSTVRVLLAEGRASLAVGSDAPYAVTDANGQRFRLPAGRVTLGPRLRVEVDGQPRALADPVRFTRGNRFLELGGRPYRGELVVRSSGGRLSVVNHVGVEAYLYGVVPDEMPPSWASEALKAQAVAARSYALVSRRSGGNFELYADTRSQVYNGVRAEDPRATRAIVATAGKVVTYGGRVAWTFFHSTSGGRTAAIHHVWNADRIPYLVSVADPHDDLSPYHSWGPVRLSARGLRSRLGSLAPRGSLLDVTVARNGSGRAQTVAARGSGGTSRFAGTSFQSRLGLRSSWFRVAVLSIRGPRRVERGRAVTLSGIARGARAPVIQQRLATGGWQRAARVRPGRGGTFRVVAKPAQTTWYRLSSPLGKGQAHRVVVVPRARS